MMRRLVVTRFKNSEEHVPGYWSPAKEKIIYDGGAHLHLNDAGYRAMADTINLKELLGQH
jgi:ribosomal protein S6